LSFRFRLDDFNGSPADIESFPHVARYCGALTSTELNCAYIHDTGAFDLHETIGRYYLLAQNAVFLEAFTAMNGF
jgi:hypothetical protein